MSSASAALDVTGMTFIRVAAAVVAVKPRGSRNRSSVLLIAGNVAIGFADIFDGDWPWSILGFAMAAVVAWLWWHHRKRRKRAGEALGAKSRALREALVRRAREAAKPRPVLRPVPGGVR